MNFFSRLYGNRRFQTATVVLYPAAVFGVLSIRTALESWLIPLGITVLFCLLWANWKVLFCATLAAIAAALPLWWFFVERHMKGAELLLASWPWILLACLGCVLIPEMLLIALRNWLMFRVIRSHARPPN